MEEFENDKLNIDVAAFLEFLYRHKTGIIHIVGHSGNGDPEDVIDWINDSIKDNKDVFRLRDESDYNPLYLYVSLSYGHITEYYNVLNALSVWLQESKVYSFMVNDKTNEKFLILDLEKQ